MDDKEFLSLYQTIKFQESDPDVFLEAAIKRKTMALNFYGSIYMNKSNYDTEFLLNADLTEYGQMVDNKEPGNINNYADHVMSLLSNYQNDDRKNWKCSFDVSELKKFLEPLPCSNSINCANADFTAEDVKEIQNALSSYEEPEELTESEPVKSNATQSEPSVQPCSSADFISNKKFFTPVQGKHDFRSNAKKNNVTYENKQDALILDEPKNKDVEVFEGSSKKGNEPVKPKELFFRTARSELEIQNAKKFKRNDGTANEKTFNYGVVKKTLGIRKGSVYSKFQPPIRNNENKNQETTVKTDVDEVVDEKLKNIDPAMVELIKNEIMDCVSKVTWDDIAGLQLAKSTIQEIVVWPMLRPDIFTGLRRPPKGILLFGPPGTGKTLIGKCIASQSNSTFFSISASSLTSKWVGDGEKMVRTLFAVARIHQPSVVFIDEIDSLLSQRSDSEHECSRRIKTEFLVQLDGAGTNEEDKILIIGATNRPQELDEAARRRLVKRLYIPLPDKEARKQIIQNLISSERHNLTDSDIEKIAEHTQGYSGADVKNLCQEASLGPIRSIPPSKIRDVSPEDVRPLNVKDFESALTKIKSSVSEKDLDIYLEWNKQYGCGSVSNSNF